MKIEKRKMWKWFVRGEATSFMPTRLVIVTTEQGFSHAVALAPPPLPVDGVEDFIIIESEEELKATYSEQPMIQPTSYYTTARQRVAEADDRRGLLAEQI